MIYKINVIQLLKVLLVIPMVAFFTSCSDKFDVIQPPGAIAPKLSDPKFVVNDVNLNKTNGLFKLIINKELGDKVGVVEMRSEGMLIHPGEMNPSKVSFKLSHTYKNLLIRPFIAALPADAIKIKEAGTIGIDFELDGRSQGRFLVNRDTRLSKNLDLTNVNTLTIVVDNADGKAWFDWLMIGVVDSK